MKTSNSYGGTAKDIREKSESWLRFIRNLDRALLNAKVKRNEKR